MASVEQLRGDFFADCEAIVCAMCNREVEVSMLAKKKINMFLPHLRMIFGEEQVDLAELTIQDLAGKEVLVCGKCNWTMQHTSDEDSSEPSDESLGLFKLEYTLQQLLLPAREQRAEEAEREEQTRNNRAKFLARFKAMPASLNGGTKRERAAKRREAQRAAARA